MYTNPPYLESLCEIIFTPNSSFDLTIPGMMFGSLKQDFPNKSDNIITQIPVRDINNNQVFQILNPQIVQFKSANNERIIQVGKDVIVSNIAFKYTSWEDFMNQIMKAYNLFSEYHTEPLKIRQITLKYIFNFQPGPNDSIESFFSFKLPNPPLDKYKKNKAFQTILEYEFGNNVLSTQLRTVRRPGELTDAYMMDLSYLNVIPEDIDVNDLQSWLNEGNNIISEFYSDMLSPDYQKSLPDEK